MPTNALKCSLQVTAGLIPGEPMKEFTRTFNFTNEQLEIPNLFIDSQGAAMNYAMMMMDPKKINWVRLDWIWY